MRNRYLFFRIGDNIVIIALLAMHVAVMHWTNIGSL